MSQNIELKNFELVTVNPNNKTWGTSDLFCFWANTVQTVLGFSLIASLYLIYDLNFGIVLLGSLIASLMIYVLVSLIGHPSQKHGIPFPVMLRMSMGLIAAKYIGFLRGVVGIFMFGVQTYFISKSISYLIRIFIYYNLDKQILENELFLSFFLELNIIDWLSLILSFYIQYLIFTNGQIFNKNFLKFSAIFVYLGLIIFLIILISENYNEVFQSLKLNTDSKDMISKINIMPLIVITGTIFAYFSIVIINFGDFSRYVKSPDSLKFGNLSLLLNMIIFSFLSITIVIGVDMFLNQKLMGIDQIITKPMDIIGKIDNTFLTIVVLVFILFSSLSTNLISNYVPSQNTLINLMPQNLDLKSFGMLIFLLGLIVAGLWPAILSQIGIISIIDSMSALFGPIFGVIIADYYLVKKEKVNHKDLFYMRENNIYFYSNGWNYKAIYALLIGFIFSFSILWNYNLQDIKTFSWIIGSLVSFVIYYLLNNE